MQTKWMEKWIKWYLTGTPCTLINTKGNNVTPSTSYPTYSNFGVSMEYAQVQQGLKKWIGSATPHSANNGVMFGDGDTPPTENDYALSGNAISNTTITVTPTVTFETDSDGLGVTRGRYVIANISQSPVTIKEVALFAALYAPTSSAYLMDRTVLTEPLTIEVGGVGILTYEIATNA